MREEENLKAPQIEHNNAETITEWDIHSAKIIPVPADGLCMYHCVHAAKDPDYVKNPNKYTRSLDDHNARAQSLKKQSMAANMIS